MANPTFDDIFDLEAAAVNDAEASLGLTASTDARHAVSKILNLLATKNVAYVDVNGELTTYKINRSAVNLDLETQRETFVINIDLKLVTNGVADEPE